MCAGVGSGGKFRRFRRVPVCAGGEFQGFGRFRSGLLPCNLDRNSHVIVFDNIVRMGKTTAEQECAHVVKHGIRLLLLGIPPKLIFFSPPVAFSKFPDPVQLSKEGKYHVKLFDGRVGRWKTLDSTPDLTCPAREIPKKTYRLAVLPFGQRGLTGRQF